MNWTVTICRLSEKWRPEFHSQQSSRPVERTSETPSFIDSANFPALAAFRQMADLNNLYDDVVMDHIKNARNYRRIENADRSVEGFNPLCGDTLTVYLRVHDGRVADVSFQCSCCGISMASASIMTEHVKGKTRDETQTSIDALLDVLAHASEPDRIAGNTAPGHLAVLNAVRDFPSRVECAALAWNTLASALDDCPE